jgi:hypothetical protein
MRYRHPHASRETGHRHDWTLKMSWRHAPVGQIGAAPEGGWWCQQPLRTSRPGYLGDHEASTAWCRTFVRGWFQAERPGPMTNRIVAGAGNAGAAAVLMPSGLRGWAS